jgi:hypothetical protein
MSKASLDFIQKKPLGKTLHLTFYGGKALPIYKSQTEVKNLILNQTRVAAHI